MFQNKIYMKKIIIDKIKNINIFVCNFVDHINTSLLWEIPNTFIDLMSLLFYFCFENVMMPIKITCF